MQEKNPEGNRRYIEIRPADWVAHLLKKAFKEGAALLLDLFGRAA